MTSAQQNANEKERTRNLQKSESRKKNTVTGELTLTVYLMIFMNMKNAYPRGGRVRYIYRKKGLHLKSTSREKQL
jgi:hypothetical protein